MMQGCMTPTDGNVSFGDVVQTLGTPLAVRIALVLRGQRLDIPHQPGPESRLVRTIGKEAADRLGRALGGSRVTVPARLARMLLVHRLRAEGRAVGDIANSLMMSRSGVQRMLRQSLPAPLTVEAVDEAAKYADLDSFFDLNGSTGTN